MLQDEHHKIHRTGWLRAAVLGANDGIVSTASLIVGVAAAQASHENIILAGTAGLVAGAMSMAAGEYVSVKSQSDTEQADLKIERQALKDNPKTELKELALIYQKRGLDKETALTVAQQMTQHNALEAHARDELGITDTLSAQPFQAAWASATTFGLGAGVPLLAALMVSPQQIMWVVPTIAILLLGFLGAFAASAGGAPKLRGALRVCFWGSLAMAVTIAVGKLIGVSI